MRLEQRVSKLEGESGIFQQAVFDRFNALDGRLNSIESRINAHLVVNIGLWVTTIAAIFGSALFIR
jgi:hypothetical protein